MQSSHANSPPSALEFERRPVLRLALLGADYPGVRFEPLLEVGAEFAAGSALLRDARRPEIRFTAPLAGKVTRIERGARRRLQSLQWQLGESAAAAEFPPPAQFERAALRSYLLETGAWTCLRARPFGRLPHPDADPRAIFVSALDRQPLAPDPRPLLEAFADEFRCALDALGEISPAPLYLCHAPEYRPQVKPSERLRCVSFDGGFNAGLAGVHIQRLCPIGFGGGEVWQLGYQEAIALGHLLLHGSPWTQRLITLTGNAVKNPRALLVAPGASLEELLHGETVDAPLRLLDGAAPCGRPIARNSFLAAGQRQLNVLLSAAETETAPALRRGAVIPGELLDALAPPGVYPAPLMRALQLGDAERARDLGALELLEEDVAALSRACVSGSDYGSLLRRVLDQLEAAR